MPTDTTNTTELTIERLVNDNLSEKKEEIKSLKKSLKQEQNKTTELRGIISQLESDNNLLKYKLENNWVKDVLKTIFSAIFGAGISLLIVPSGFNSLIIVTLILFGLIGYILTSLVNDKKNG